MDPRFEKLADLFISHSTGLQQGEVVIIEYADEVPLDMIRALIVGAQEAGGHPVVWCKRQALLREVLMRASEEEIKVAAEGEFTQMVQAKAYIGLRGYANATELADVPVDNMFLYKEHWLKPVHLEQRVKRTKWVISRWPSPSMAQMAEMSTAAFEDFYFRVCTDVDYARMERAMKPLADLMAGTDMVRISGPGDTDIAFSIKGISGEACAGRKNVPDGEYYTAPVRGSVNGVIYFNTPTLYDGRPFAGIRLVFTDGKIVEARCESGDRKELEAILDTDEGARYVGEFALGLNPLIERAMRDTLFDEKIAGSIHLTPGCCYDEAPNGNESRIHWDLVLIQTPEYGGGELYFDGELIRRDGRFIPQSLWGLNPENLLAQPA